MHADGVRIFVEVVRAGNLTGFVEDTLRGRPHFAVAANLPRRSGLTQLNHLVASLYAQGVALRPDYLYARRRPQRIDLAADIRPARHSPAAGRRLPRDAALAPDWPSGSASRTAGRAHAPEPITLNGAPASSSLRQQVDGHRNGASPRHKDWNRPGDAIAGRDRLRRIPTPDPAPEAADDATSRCCAYLRTMDEFLETQRQVMERLPRVPSKPFRRTRRDRSDHSMSSTPD